MKEGIQRNESPNYEPILLPRCRCTCSEHDGLWEGSSESPGRYRKGDRARFRQVRVPGGLIIWHSSRQYILNIHLSSIYRRG